MADEPGNPGVPSRQQVEAEGAPAANEGKRDWRGVWQLPTLIGAGGLLVAGIAALLMGRPEPNFDMMLGRIQTMVQSQEYRPALDELNGTVRPWYDSGSLSPEQMRQFHLLRARSVYLGERELGLERPDNARSVIDEFEAALRAGAGEPLTEPRDVYFLAEAHVTLGLYERALGLARSLKAMDHGRSGDEIDWAKVGLPRIYRRVVERQLNDPQSDGELALRLLGEFLAEAALSASDRAWALTKQSQILIRKGDYEAAIARLLRTIPGLLPEIISEEAGELYLLLGHAYSETGALVEAARQLRVGLEFFLDTDERWARATVLLARIEEAIGDPAEDAFVDARQKYLTVIARFDWSSERLAALLGLAEVEAIMGDAESSIVAYGQLVDSILDGRSHPDVTPAAVVSSLLSRWRGKFDADESEVALRYALLAERLARTPMGRVTTSSEESTPTPEVPADVLLAIARSHRALADLPLPQQAGASAAGESRAQHIAELDAATRQSVRAHLASAARYYRKHADTVGISDNIAFGESLWHAAISYDLAGDLEASIPLFADYVRFFPSDPRRGEARYRLGRAYQARGDYSVAAEHFQALLADARSAASLGRGGGAGPADPGAVGVGPFADLSIVPLAQVLLLDGNPSTDAQAESLLNEVVAGRVGGVATPQFREGLIQLGLVLQRRGDYPGSIERLEEAVTRFPDHRGAEGVKFQLAEAHRQDAMAIRRTLAEAMPDHRRQVLRQTRLERLQRAEALYEEVRQSLELIEPRRRSRLEDIQLRNSYFYLGDCAFEKREYEIAIQRYDAARERFPSDPAALVAMVQIVNAYVEQGDMQRAATANERARRFYQSLPQSAWNDPDLPMSQGDWQRWLDSMTALRPLRTPDSAERTAGAEERER